MRFARFFIIICKLIGLTIQHCHHSSDQIVIGSVVLQQWEDDSISSGDGHFNCSSKISLGCIMFMSMSSPKSLHNVPGICAKLNIGQTEQIHPHGFKSHRVSPSMATALWGMVFGQTYLILSRKNYCVLSGCDVFESTEVDREIILVSQNWGILENRTT